MKKMKQYKLPAIKRKKFDSKKFLRLAREVGEILREEEQKYRIYLSEQEYEDSISSRFS